MRYLKYTNFVALLLLISAKAFAIKIGDRVSYLPFDSKTSDGILGKVTAIDPIVVMLDSDVEVRPSISQLRILKDSLAPSSCRDGSFEIALEAPKLAKDFSGISNNEESSTEPHFTRLSIGGLKAAKNFDSGLFFEDHEQLKEVDSEEQLSAQNCDPGMTTRKIREEMLVLAESDPYSMPFGNEKERRDREIAIQTAVIAGEISNYNAVFRGSLEEGHLFAICDRNGKIASAGVLKSGEGHPFSLKSDLIVKFVVSKEKGGGAAAIQYAVKQMILDGKKDIILIPAESIAASFYKHIGFENGKMGTAILTRERIAAVSEGEKPLSYYQKFIPYLKKSNNYVQKK